MKTAANNASKSMLWESTGKPANELQVEESLQLPANRIPQVKAWTAEVSRKTI